MIPARVAVIDRLALRRYVAPAREALRPGPLGDLDLERVLFAFDVLDDARAHGWAGKVARMLLDAGVVDVEERPGGGFVARLTRKEAA